MIVYHKNNEIDREQWDSCIKNSRGAKPYAYSWYLDIMAPGWEALVDDEYDSVFPVPGFSRFGIKYSSNPIFLQQLGVFSPDKLASDSIIEFLDYMPVNFKLIDLCIAQKINHNGFKVTERSNYELDLSKPYEKIWDNFTNHCKRNIELSARKKPELTADITPDEITDLFILNKGKEIKGIKMRDYQKLKNLMNFCVKNKRGRLLGVRATKRKLIYGLFIVETHGCKTLQLVVNTPQSRERRIGYFAINNLIRDHSSTRNILDFAGSSIPSIASFMESWGSVKKPYYRIYRNRLFWPARLLK